MNNTDVLSNFFTKEYEDKINNRTTFYSYVIPEADIRKYINDILNVPIGEFIAYLHSHPAQSPISAKDIFQFSDFNDASINICNELLAIDNPGVTHLEAGRLLQQDGILRSAGADTKYGENHLKTATMLGLLFELTKTYFVSCIGMYYPSLPDDEKQRLMTRLILRTNLISYIINVCRYGTVDVRLLLYMISDSTYNRRKSNIKTVLNILFSSKEYDFSNVKNSLVF